jgi:hypothetical protein
MKNIKPGLNVSVDYCNSFRDWKYPLEKNNKEAQ